MNRISRFRRQACHAQKLLTSIVEGRYVGKSETLCLSHLTSHHNPGYETVMSHKPASHDNFVDCGSADRCDSDLDDIPLSELHTNVLTGSEHIFTGEVENRKSIRKSFKTKSKQNALSERRIKKYFTLTRMTEMEMYDEREERKMATAFADASYKCELCVLGFMTQIELDSHNDVHKEKPGYIKCDVCSSYVESGHLSTHHTGHIERYKCSICEYISYKSDTMLEHVRSDHMNECLQRAKTKGIKTTLVHKPKLKGVKNKLTMEKQTNGYLCKECNKYFLNKNQRWKHVQKHHREGYKCAECDKCFAFKNNLTRHEQLHQAPLPREKCPICHKMIRIDLAKAHAKIHSDRERMACEECGKIFASRSSYEHHLKYTRPHAPIDILKHKCNLCDKGYRSRGELKDHVNYQHLATTRHKCPICDKPLATRRCITRHVRRAHDGVKESARDKICQQCGKAFRDKKGLREHELIHSGERPLACEICGGTFRQSASLYTHKKRVHHIYPAKKNVKLVDS